MPFRPNPNDELTINGVTYHIAEHPAAPGMPYGQEGRAGIVYRLLSSASEGQALKVFKPRFRLPYLVSQAERIAAYADLSGLQVCRRTVLTPSRHADLLRQYADLTYAVLMPWIEGPTWLEVILDRKPFTSEQSLALARALAEVLVHMEEQGIAHCDLSGPNVMLPALAEGEGVALVDVEGLYAPGLPQPEALSSGSAGYAHKTAKDGLWSTKADRFAGAVLLAEMLGWCDPQVCQSAWSESYFEPKEMQQESERYRILVTSLSHHWGDGLAALFEHAWRSDSLADCPTFGEWLVALPVSSEKVISGEVKSENLKVRSDKGRVEWNLESDSSKTFPGGEEKPIEQVETLREVRALMQAARRLEERGNLDGALDAYYQAQELAVSDPALRSLAHEITLTLQDLEVRRGGIAQGTLPQPVPAPVVQTGYPYQSVSAESSYEIQAETKPRTGNRGIKFVLWGILLPVVIISMLFFVAWVIDTGLPYVEVERMKFNGELLPLEHVDKVTNVEVSSDNTYLVSSSSTYVYLWQVPEGNQLAMWETSVNIDEIALSPNNEFLAVGADTTLQVWHISDRTLLYTMEASDRIMDFSFSPDGKLLGIAGGNTLDLYSVANGTLLYAINPSETISHFSFSPDCMFLAADEDKYLQIWRISDGTLMNTLSDSEGFIGFSFSPDSSILVVSPAKPGEGGGLVRESVQLRRVSDNLLLNTFQPGEFEFSPDGSLLGLGSEEAIQLWRVADGTLINTLKPLGQLDSFTFSPDGTLLASYSFGLSSGQGKGMQLWRISDGSLLNTVQDNSWYIDLIFLDNSTLTGVGDRISIWRIPDGQLLGSLPILDQFSRPNSGESLAFGQSFLSNGKLWHYFYTGNTIWLWRINNK